MAAATSAIPATLTRIMRRISRLSNGQSVAMFQGILLGQDQDRGLECPLSGVGGPGIDYIAAALERHRELTVRRP